MVARTMLDTLRQVATNKEDLESVFDIVARLAQDIGTAFIYWHDTS
jgi:hypothetical protein